ncbi:MAG: DUF885 domain-containing protein [Bdellovibrionales bacterium]|nr:DUF885 domain-containing protein [Bdellovibrionales bacterium]
MLFIGATLVFVAATGCGSSAKKGASRKLAPWIETSNVIAEEFSLSLAAIRPEHGSYIGYRQFDRLATRNDEELDSRLKMFFQDWSTRLKALVAEQKDPEVRLDYEILLENVERSAASFDLHERNGSVSFTKVAESVFYSLRGLINEQTSKDRKDAAIERFHRYVRGFEENEKRARPYTEAARAETERKIKRYTSKNGPSRGRVFYPLKAEIERYLKNSEQVLVGIENMLKETGRDDWRNDFEAFRIQVRTYDNWLRTSLLPSARTDFRLPLEIYADRLRQFGHIATPKSVRDLARQEFSKNMRQYQELARQIAQRDGLKDSKIKNVVGHLKKSVETDPEKVRERYVRADAELSAEIRRRDLVTLPTTPLRIRLASEAESRVQPVPHLTTPSFVGNTGERPEFVVPVGSREKLAFDDFAFAAAAKSLTAHEGRPGHDLQFSSVLDRGVSTIRANYSFNSVNVEGWALYAEWLMEESLSLDEKMALMMMRLMRNVRMFLDPELHLGLIKPQAAKRVITEQVGMSPEWADLELERYMYRIPGQAPSYYYGYLKFHEMRAGAIKRLGGSFAERCFHDAILDQGILPLVAMAKKIETLTCD